MKRNHRIALLGLITAMLLPATSSAYYLEVRGEAGAQVPVRFSDANETTADTIDVEYRINSASLPSGATAEAVEAAFASWSGAGCTSLVFNEGADSASTDRSHWVGDGDAHYVLVYWTDAAEEWTSGPAVGHFYFGYSETVEMIGATVVLNSRDHAWSTDGTAGTLDVQGTVTALIGRALGITSAMEGNATYPRYAPGDTSKRTLGADDIAAIQYLYPGSDVSCAEPTVPESECDGVTLPGEEPCPPRPETMTPDGGTLPQVDAGTPPTTDAGTGGGVDAGDGGPEDDGGCSVGHGGTHGSAALWLLGLAALVLRRRRR